MRTESDTPFVVASAEGRDLAFGDPWSGLGFVSARDIFTLVAEDYWLKLEIVTTMQTGTVGPARCTFSGTAELVRK